MTWRRSTRNSSSTPYSTKYFRTGCRERHRRLVSGVTGPRQGEDHDQVSAADEPRRRYVDHDHARVERRGPQGPPRPPDGDPGPTARARRAGRRPGPDLAEAREGRTRG